LKKKDRLIFMSSHLLSEVADVCDEVAMIDHGKLLVYDTLPNITAKFSGGSNTVEVGLLRPIDPATVQNSVAGISGVLSAEKKDDRNLVIKCAAGLEVQERVLSDLVRLNMGVVSFRPTTLALEESYLNLIKDTL